MSNQFGDTRIDDDLTLLSETLEEVLRSSGDPADQKYVELKARAEKALDDVKKRVSQASDSYYYRAKQAVYRADDYVHENPGKELVWVRPLGWFWDCCWHAVKTSLHRGTAFFVVPRIM